MGKEKKNSSQALWESEKQYSSLFIDNSAVMLLIDPSTGNIVDANEAASKFYGYTRNELTTMKIQNINTLSEEQVEAEMEKAKNMEQNHFLFEHRLASGTIKPVEVYSGKVTLRDKPFLFSIIHDITGCKQAEEALKESEEHFRTLFENSTIGIYRTTPEGQILLANPTLIKLLGYSSFEEFAGRNLAEDGFEPSYERTHFMDIIKREGEVKGLESAWTRMDGITLFLSESARAVNDKEGKIIYYDGIVEDITLRKKTEQELIIANKELVYQNEEKEKRVAELVIANEAILQSEKNFHRSISKSPMGIRIVSTDGKTIYANKAFLAIFELNSLEEFTSIPAINLYTPESYAQHQKRKEKRNNGHDVFDYEISIVCANAGIRHIKVWRREVLWNGTKHYQVINLDITEQKKLTIDLIAAKEKAEESDRLKTAFLQNISHEIRTPLNAILGFSELLKDTTSSQEDIRFYLEQINFGKDDLLELIENVVFASKIDTKQIISVKKEFNLNDSLNNLISNSKKLLKRKDKSHLDFLTHIESTQNITIEADENNLNIALCHLIDNAIKYTDFGEIEIGTKLIENSEVEFYIRDTGIGIDKSEFEKIFDKFYKVESNQNKLFRGAGIGLTIVKGIAEAFGGKAWINSIVDEGSTFYFSIPVNVVKSKLKHYEPEEDISKLVENWGERNILIAEDVDINLKYLDKVLDFRNITRFQAKNGKAAVEIIKTVKIDLVLMDILMPLMDGYEASTIIKTMFPSVPIIAQTAIYYNHNNKDSNLLDLFNDYIVKPISPDTLIKVLDRFLKLNK